MAASFPVTLRSQLLASAATIPYHRPRRLHGRSLGPWGWTFELARWRQHRDLSGGRMGFKTTRLAGFVAIATLLLLGAQDPSPDLRTAQETIDADEMLRHIQVLASDEFEGRAPGSRGAE